MSFKPISDYQQKLQEQYCVEISQKGKNCTAIYRNPNYKSMDLIKNPGPGLETLQQIWFKSVSQYGKRPYLWQRNQAGKYDFKTYEQVDTIAKEIGSGVINLKLAETKNDFKNYQITMIGIYAKNREEWLMVDIGCSQIYGMTSVPLYDSLGPDAVSYCLNHSGLTVVFADSQSIDILLETQNIGQLKSIVSFDQISTNQIEKAQQRELNLYSLNEIRSQGRKQIRPFNYVTNVTPNHICAFSYTSGTTSDPKAAMIKHSNFTSVIACITLQQKQSIQIVQDDIHLSYLPLPHVFDRLICHTITYKGAQIGFNCGDITKIKDDMCDLKPTIFISVPRLYNKIYDGIKAKFEQEGCLSRFIINKGLSAKLDNLNTQKIMTHAFYDKIIFNKVAKNVFGGKVRVMITGSAPLAAEVQQFFSVVFSCPFIQGYGLTESSGQGICQVTNDVYGGVIGGPIANSEIKLQDIPDMNYLSTDTDEEGNPCPRGEICIRGPIIFEGYYKDQDKTNETIDQEGWLHTGDVGQIDYKRNNAIKIIDRKKNIFKLSQGEYIAPEKLENIYLNTDGILESFIYGDSYKSYIIGFFVPDQNYVQNLAIKLGIQKDQKYEQLLEDQNLVSEFKDQLCNTGKKYKLRGFEIVKYIKLLPKSLMLYGCLTNTMKTQGKRDI